MLGVVAMFAVVSAQGQAPAIRYRYEVKTTTSIDLTSMGQPNVNQQSTTVAFLSVSTRDSASGMLASVTIDSLTINDGGAAAQAKDYLPPEMTVTGKGTVFSLYVSGGRVSRYSSSKPTNLEATAVSGAITMIFPSLPNRVRIGDSWTDTTATAVGEEMKAKSTEINTWTLRTADSLVASVATSASSEVSSEMGTMTTTGSGTRQLLLTISQQVRSGTLSLNTTGALGDVKIKGTTNATLLRLP